MTAIRSVGDAHDLTQGLMLLGTGGGGWLEIGLNNLLPHIQAGHTITFTRPETLDDDAWVCSVFTMGSVAPSEPLTAVERVKLGYPADWTVAWPMVRAVEELQVYTGRKIAAVVPFELGAGNTTSCINAAVRLGIPCIDGDYAGRAIPALHQASAAIAGFSFTPGVVADPWGNVVIMKNAGSTQLAERIGKLISLATKLPDMKALCIHAGFLMQARDLRTVVIPGGLSRAFRVGREIRGARETGGDPVAAAARALDGWVLFEGTVRKKTWESRDGYMVGTTTIEGAGEHRGHTLKIWFKNENHITWYDESPWVMSPDLIMVMDAHRGEAYTNTFLVQGAVVGVIGARAEARLRMADALERLGPQAYGFDYEYAPIEKLVPRS